jgi:hypothetical protein
MRISTGALCSLSLFAVSMTVVTPAWSQEKIGVVTAVAGPVRVARVSTPPEPLKFKDPVFLRDRVTTGDNAITRILLGGKVIVTARERSTLTITEIPGLSTIDLASGRIAVAVDKTRMKPGERVEIRTLNAIAGVRGTVLIVEAERNVSTVTVLRGLVDVVRVDTKTGRAVGPVTPVGTHQAVTVRSDVLPARPQAIPPARAEVLSKEFTPPMRQVTASTVMPVDDEVERAAALLNALLPSEKASSAPAAPNATPMAATSTLPTTPTLTTTVTPTTSLVTTTPVPTTTSLLQPIVQPVVQTIVQPVTNLLKLP